MKVGTHMRDDTGIFNHYCIFVQRMCSAFPCFLKPPGLNVPVIIVPDDMIANKPISLSCTGYSVLKPFLTKQGREVDRVLGDGNCLFKAFSKAICGAEDYHLHLLKAIAEFETDNHSLFKSIHETVNRTKFHTHVQNISKLYTWGTSIQGRRNWSGRPGSCRTKVLINSIEFHNQFKSFSIVCNYARRYLAKLNSRFNEY